MSTVISPSVAPIEPRATSRARRPAAERWTRPRVAAILNANACKVSPRVVDEVRQHLPREDVFLTRSLDEARALTDSLVEHGYSTVLLGGGDGTVTRGITDLYAAARRR